MTSPQLFFKYEHGYINIDADNIYFSSTGNWTDVTKLAEKNFGEQKHSRTDNTITYVFIAIALVFAFGIFRNLGSGQFGIPLGVIGCFLIYKRLSKDFNTELGERFMIPRTKLLSLESTSEDSITFEFHTLDNKVSTYQTSGLDPYSKYQVLHELGLEEPVILPFDAQYEEEVQQLIVNIQHNEFGIPITIQDQPDLMNIPEFYQQKNGNFWVAVSEDKVVGTISLLDIGNGRGALRKMFVAADYRGKEYGIGQALLDHLLAWAKEKQFNTILLGTTEKFLAAHRFYEKNGFTEISRNDLPPEFPVMNVDVKFYSYKVA